MTPGQRVATGIILLPAVVFVGSFMFKNPAEAAATAILGLVVVLALAVWVVLGAVVGTLVDNHIDESRDSEHLRNRTKRE